ncbi:hypothetical protein HII36_22785, partial [Nonomuraea sp. NN258]|uniref:hypothetical protein n=1 Tax=Nonomuraea antri TaxID=2730852 RepID=UPI0015686554
MAYYPALQHKAALDALKAAAKSKPRFLVGAAIAATAVANLQGMGEAKSNWNALAKALEVEYPTLVGNTVYLTRAGGWIADDRLAFAEAAAMFGGDLQKLSGLCYTMEGQVDEMRDAYALYWTEIAALAATVLGYVVAARAMLLTPHLRAGGELMLERLVTLTNFIIAQKNKILISFLGLAGATMAKSSQSMGQLFSVQPTGAAKIDFQRAVISTDPPSRWIAPKRELPAPAQT